MVDGMCKTSLGIVLKPMMAVFGLGDQVDQIQEALESGDPAEIAVRFVQLVCMLFGLTSQCFTGDTLVSTETGLRPIAEIQIGDYVWSEDTETGEKELKQVTDVSVTMTNTLVYVTTEDGTSINTTENHPFYVEGKGWCVAAELEVGDICRTKEGQTEVVASVVIEEKEEPVKVYNLTIEDNHTYYVSADEVLVHNDCSEKHHIASDKSIKSGYTAKYQELFDLAGMKLNDPDNIVELKGHKGAHTKIYKQKVLDYLTQALEGIDKNNKEENEKALRAALKELAALLESNPRLPYKGGWED